MFKKLIIILLAVICVALGVFVVIKQQVPAPKEIPIAAHSESPAKKIINVPEEYTELKKAFQSYVSSEQSIFDIETGDTLVYRLKRLIDYQPEKEIAVEAWRMLCACYEQLGEYKLMDEAFNQYLQSLEPDTATIQHELKKFASKRKVLKAYRSAVHYFSLLKENYPSSSEMDFVEYSLGTCYEAQKNYGFAHREYESVITNYPNSRWCDVSYYRNGHIYFLEHEFDEAKENLQLLLKEFPESHFAEHAQYNLAKIYKITGANAKAEIMYLKLKEKYPDTRYNQL